MKLRGIRSVHLVAGGLTILVGILTSLEALRYTIGTARSMGPGYFPLVLGIMAVICGLGIIFYDGPRNPDMALERPAVRPLLAVAAAILIFTLVVERLGLVPAVSLAAFVSSFAEPRPRLLSAALLAACLGLFAYLIFNLGLGVQAEAFKWNF